MDTDKLVEALEALESGSVPFEDWAKRFTRRSLSSAESKRLAAETLTRARRLIEELKAVRKDGDRWHRLFDVWLKKAADLREENERLKTDTWREWETRLAAAEEVIAYAAGMPDSDTMPEWAKELRHHARHYEEGKK